MEKFLMNSKEIERDRIFSAVKSQSINLIQASKLLHLSYSQTKRLWFDYKKYGQKSLISKKICEEIELRRPFFRPLM